MTFRDMTDEEVARAVLKRLSGMGLTTLRPMEDAGPVSRTTLSAWADGRYTMQGPTRARCLEWLGAVQPEPGAPLTEDQEKLVAAKWLEKLALRLRREATAGREDDDVDADVEEAIRADAEAPPPPTGARPKKRAQGG